MLDRDFRVLLDETPLKSVAKLYVPILHHENTQAGGHQDPIHPKGTLRLKSAISSSNYTNFLPATNVRRRVSMIVSVRVSCTVCYFFINVGTK